MFKSIFFLSLLGLISSLDPNRIESSDSNLYVNVNYMYGDDYVMILNQVMKDGEKMNRLKSGLDLNEAIPPLPQGDVKCLISVDRYCSKHMLEMKKILIYALREDCAKCTKEQKEQAGTIVASMLAHDPVAWKLFLTRYTIQNLPEKEPIKENKAHYKLVGEPEIIESSEKRHVMPGVKVRVKRFAVERVD